MTKRHKNIDFRLIFGVGTKLERKESKPTKKTNPLKGGTKNDNDPLS